MLIVGLTGGIGSGKTTVASMLASRGAYVIDVDDIGRRIVGPGGEGVEAVIRRFGDHLYDEAGGIDRAGLAAIVFADPEALGDLNAISHPLINARLDALAGTAEPDSIVVYDMAVLVESTLGTGIEHGYEIVVNVEAPRHVRVARLGERGVAPDEAQRRMESQATDEERRAASQFVITNGGDLEALRHAVGELWATLQRLADEKHRPVG